MGIMMGTARVFTDLLAFQQVSVMSCRVFVFETFFLYISLGIVAWVGVERGQVASTVALAMCDSTCVI